VKNTYIVLGAGTQGVAAAFDLALNGSATRVTLADISLSKSRAAVQRIRTLLAARGAPCPRLTASVVDARRESDLFKTILGHDGTLSALPSRLNLGAARASIAARTHYVDLGGPFETTQDILRLDRPAQKMGVALVPDAGLAPGLCNAVAADAIARLEKIDSVRLYAGALPERNIPPLGYKRVSDLEGVLAQYFGISHVLKNGQVNQVGGFSDREDISFPAPVGPVEAFVTGGVTSTSPWTFEGRVRSYIFKTLRYPGHYEKILALKELGLLDEKPAAVNGLTVSPRKLFLAVAQPRLEHPEIRDMAILRVVASGQQSGRPLEWTYDVLEYEDGATGFSALQRVAGFSAAAALSLLVTEFVRARGVAPLERSFPATLYLESVQKRGIRLRVLSSSPASNGNGNSLKKDSGIQ
jgi:lysine 6-dehydrogenase